VTPLDLSIGFSLGLVGSLHCVQMCGPIVLAYSLPLGSGSRAAQGLAHLSYNVGRIVTYSLLGALAGVAGGLVRDLSGFKNAATILAGALMVLAGVLMLGALGRSGLVQINAFKPGSAISRLVSRVLQSTTPRSKLGLGLVLGLLPCGLVYAALMKAAETASPLGGALTMLAFGAGTAGALFVMGMFSSTVGRWLGKRSNLIAAVMVILVGAYLLYRGLTMGSGGGQHMHH
jgi:sulfite exporter TauE/SafE